MTQIMYANFNSPILNNITDAFNCLAKDGSSSATIKVLQKLGRATMHMIMPTISLLSDTVILVSVIIDVLIKIFQFLRCLVVDF